MNERRRGNGEGAAAIVASPGEPSPLLIPEIERERERKVEEKREKDPCRPKFSSPPTEQVSYLVSRGWGDGRVAPLCCVSSGGARPCPLGLGL